jgi:primosomal protein N' (replication factor Y)
MDPYVLDIAVPYPLYQNYTYLSPEPVQLGCRVLVSFRKKQEIGVVVGVEQKWKDLPALQGKGSYLSIEKTIDQEPIFDERLLKLAHWLAEYYLCPLGEVLQTMLPGSYEDKKEVLFMPTPKADKWDKLPEVTALLGGGFHKKNWTQALKNQDLALQDLLDRGFVVKKNITKKNPFVLGPQAGKEALPQEPQRALFPLKPSQEKAFLEIKEKIDLKPVLLHGVTGSGKTEIYLHLMEERLRENPKAQILLMVPEISLTPQITGIFESRFPGQVSSVHSQLPKKTRWQRLEAIRQGSARILIGPRSSVFAGFKSLGLIVVDEEHDTSYKQDSGLTYHGRDTAVYRGYLEGCPVLLGSATPSLESYHNSKIGKYAYVPLRERITGKPLPQVTLVDAFKGKIAQGFMGGSPLIYEDDREPFSFEVMEALGENLKKGEPSIVLINRRGFAFYLMNQVTKKPVHCHQCAITLTLHKERNLLKCHYCSQEIPLAGFLAAHRGVRFLAVGLGSQKAEHCLKRSFPGVRIERLDSDNSGKKSYTEGILQEFRSGQIPILVGTQILAKGHDFPDLTLIVLCDIEKNLNLPDFRSGERTFQLLVQAAGRPGRAEKPGRVLLETKEADHPVLLAGLSYAYEDFAEKELAFRKAHLYPPFYKLVHVELSAPQTHLKPLDELVARLVLWIEKDGHRLLKNAKVVGPQIPSLHLLNNRIRRTLLIHTPSHGMIRGFMTDLLAVFSPLAKAPLRLTVDVDPQSIL